jgi:hypothetical protein
MAIPTPPIPIDFVPVAIIRSPLVAWSVSRVAKESTIGLKGREWAGIGWLQKGSPNPAIGI